MSIIRKKDGIVLMRDINIITIEKDGQELSMMEISGIDGKTVCIALPREQFKGMVQYLLENCGELGPKSGTADMMYR